MSAKKTKDITALLDEEGKAAEANADAPITDSTTVTRGHGRSKTLQIRLNPDELEELERVAASRGLPTSTIAREGILRLIRPELSRTADARRLVEDFAHYVDSLAANPNISHLDVHGPLGGSFQGTAAEAMREKFAEFNRKSQELEQQLAALLTEIPSSRR